jgi:hypothetical protein
LRVKPATANTEIKVSGATNSAGIRWRPL